MKIKNTSAIPLRAAYLHGPYTLYAACYPSTFDPNLKIERPDQDGKPQFEPNLKAGGSWSAQLTVPDNIRETAGKANVRRTIDGGIPSSTWIIEISSQVIFSTSAAVHFELLVGRDEKSVELGFATLTGAPQSTPGQVQDHQQGKKNRGRAGDAQPKGVYSKAIELVVDDTESLWNKPVLPQWGEELPEHNQSPNQVNMKDQEPGNISNEAETPPRRSKSRKRKRVHLVVLTHGLHSNLGSDMLYLKESIDTAARQARKSAEKSKRPKAPRGQGDQQSSVHTSIDKATSTAYPSVDQEGLDPEGVSPLSDDSDDEEEVIVRGFSGNVIRTERGIQYLGKRLAKYVLSMTYPDQPFLPVKKSISKTLSRALGSQEHSDVPSHHHSSIRKGSSAPPDLAYEITSISFIGHSLGGLTQTYAIAYIYKHSPEFFKKIKPINFVTLATPFLGLSNENPIYVKFALDFGLVGRTGQDLGLTWRPPTVVRSGWGAIIGGIGTEGQRAHKQVDPGSKPLLRILPTGPAHHVLKMFRNRTVYSNVVNDGIVPLRTSCLLFLDWRGLGRVEKARRENGLVGTMAGWGWAELTGANSSSPRSLRALTENGENSQNDNSGDEGSNTPTRQGEGDTVPQPTENATKHDNTNESQEDPVPKQFLTLNGNPFQNEDYDSQKSKESSPAQPSHPLSGLFSFLRPSNAGKSHQNPPKSTKIYERSQIIKNAQDDKANQTSNIPAKPLSPNGRPLATRGDSFLEDPENSLAPPKTTFFESAGDILNPPLPTESFLIDPSKRPRTIFHDRVYHPEDIPPPPPLKRRSTLLRSLSSDGKNGPSLSNTLYDQPGDQIHTNGLKVEEKIARAYHRDLSWRKVLVRLEPDAHNNIVVRRMFANAYGWPVIKHLVDTHFADTYSAMTADQKESNEERAKPIGEGVGEHGEELRDNLQKKPQRSRSESREADDQLEELKSPTDSLASSRSRRPTLYSDGSSDWDRFFEEGTEDEEDDFDLSGLRSPPQTSPGDLRHDSETTRGTSEAEIADFLTMSPVKTSELSPLSSPHDHSSSSKPRSPIIPRPPNSPPSKSAAGLGLQKSIEEQLTRNV